MMKCLQRDYGWTDKFKWVNGNDYVLIVLVDDCDDEIDGVGGGDDDDGGHDNTDGDDSGFGVDVDVFDGG